MPTSPKKNNSTQTNATSNNSSATANNASPAPSSSSSGFPPPPPNLSRLTPIYRFPRVGGDKRYAAAPGGGPPNGGFVPGIYQHDNGFIVAVPEPPLANPTGGTQADQPPPPPYSSASSSSTGQNAPRDDAAGQKRHGDGK